MPFFTVVIPVLNKALEVEKALYSVLNQTFNDVEILVFDGGSTDGTLDVIRSIIDPRITLFSKVDNGVYDAMNQGIEKSTGKWIYFLGADDRLYSENVLLEVRDELLNSTCKVFYGNVLINGNCSWAADGQIYDGRFSILKLIKTNICHQSIFYKISFLNRFKLRFNLKYNVCADWDFNLRCRRITSFLFKDILIAFFKTGGLSSNASDLFQFDIRKRYWDFFLIDKVTSIYRKFI